MWEILSKLLTNVDYYRGDKKIYSVDTIAGSVFALTGIRHGAFAVNCDTRKAKHFSDDLISVLIKNSIPTLWLLRNVLAEETTYAAATKKLRTEVIGGPVYFVVSGVGANEGMVIERDTDAVHAYYELSDTTWFLIQTNYDRDEPEPVYDPRRIPVEKKMQERGNTGFTEQTLLDHFMFQWPTYNIATIMSTVMVPATGYHNTTVWYGANPV
jgi:acid ceramidase/N-acylethanolamine-hydrolysing acid amidase